MLWEFTDLHLILCGGGVVVEGRAFYALRFLNF